MRRSVAAYDDRHIAGLLDDDPARQRMGTTGRRRVEDDLAWAHQRDVDAITFVLKDRVHVADQAG